MRQKWSRCIMVLGAVAFLLGASNTEGRDEENARKLLKERLAPFEKSSQSDLEKSICGEIDSLTNLLIGGRAEAYYWGLMEKWETCVSKQSLPTMERFMKRAAQLRAKSESSLPFDVFGPLDARIPNLWFKVKTEGMSQKEKTKVAVSGFIGQLAPVPTTYVVSSEWLKQMKTPDRSVLYDLLDRATDGMNDHLTSTAIALLLLRSHADAGLRPTEAEILKYLNEPSALGHMVMVKYLVEKKEYEKALPALLQMLRSDQFDRKTAALNSLKMLREYRERVIPEVIREAGKKRLIPRSRLPFRDDVPDSRRNRAFWVLQSMGK
jgi:hypothetical protein